MSKASIQIFYARINSHAIVANWNKLIQKIPPHHHPDIHKFIQPADRHRALFGKLLLIHGITLMGRLELKSLPLHYTDFNRPYFKNEQIDFNISHSGEFVICAFTQKGRIGIDIEKINAIHLEEFTSVMTEEQIVFIKQSTAPELEFFRLWTLKESVVKAVGKGLSIPLNQLTTDYLTVNCEEQIWYLHELDIDDDYCAYLASDQDSVTINVTSVQFVS